MLDRLSFLIVEDKEQEARTIQDVLSDLGFDAAKCVGMAQTALGARDQLTDPQNQPDLVFLDLNIPETIQASTSDKNTGYKLLNWIHELNVQRARKVRVIIVSGEHTLPAAVDEGFRKSHGGTLVDIVFKGDLRESLERAVRRLISDPLLEEIIRLGVGIDQEYVTLIDPASSTGDKCEAAKRIACRLLENDGDYRRGKLGACRFGDDLKGAISEVIKKRFSADKNGNTWVEKSTINPAAGWEHFLWRGVMLEHLYGINNYRNRFGHLPDHDYRSSDPPKDEWRAPADVLKFFMDGLDVAPIVQTEVQALLKWYLPWHDQVYLPWFKAQKPGGSRR